MKWFQDSNKIDSKAISNYIKLRDRMELTKVVQKSEHKNTYFTRPSPTFSYQSHQSWGHNQVCALNGIHTIHQPEVCGTIKFPDGNSVLISKFLSTYAKKMRYENAKKQNIIKPAFFGFLEVRDHDYLIHMHFLARNFQICYLDEHLTKFNKNHKTKFAISYYDIIQDIPAITAYPFKFAKEEKIIFRKGALRRYVFHCGNYFLGNKREYEKLGRKMYFKQINRSKNKQKFTCDGS